jgi:hypothetical protein
MKHLIFVLVVGSFFMNGCKKEPVSPAILISPGGLHVMIDGGSVVEFTVNAYAGDEDLRNIEIVQKPDGGVSSTVLDTLISGQVSDFFWIYEMPLGEDDVVITFNVYDTAGRRGQALRRVTSEGNVLLAESSGHHLYSVYSTSSPNAFDLDNLEPLFLSTNPDSSIVDLIELDDLDDDTPSGMITSRSGIKFTRNNSFNYAEATQFSAGNSFSSSTPLQVLSNLEIDDIIITEYDTLMHRFAVLKLTAIQDNNGSDEDRYTFNVKK